MVQDVTITATGSNRIFSCGNIAPRGICSNRMPRRTYKRNPVKVDWVFGNVARQTSEFILEVPATMEIGLPLRGVLEINEQGNISAYFEQDGTFH